MHSTDTAAERPAPAHVLLSLALLIVALLTSGCGNRNRVEAEPAAIRTPVPTFTPTPTQSSGDSAAAVQAAIQAAVPPPAPAPAGNESASEFAPVTPLPTVETPAPDGIGGPVGPIEPIPSAGQPIALSPEPTVAPDFQPPSASVNNELVNGREGPDTNAGVVLVLGSGEEYHITGKSVDGQWWRLCCALGKEVWAKAEFIDTSASPDSIPVTEPGDLSTYASAILTATPAPDAVVSAPEATPQPAEVAAAAAEPPADPAPIGEAKAVTAEEAAAEAAQAAVASGFDLVASEQFPETNVVRFFLFAYTGSNEALEGFSLRVTKDGVEQTVTGESWGGQPGLTWPFPDERQRFQNFKVEFPGVSPAGTWTADLTQGGKVVGPAATFTLGDGDTNQELYVRYQRK